MRAVGNNKGYSFIYLKGWMDRWIDGLIHQWRLNPTQSRLEKFTMIGQDPSWFPACHIISEQEACFRVRPSRIHIYQWNRLSYLLSWQEFLIPNRSPSEIHVTPSHTFNLYSSLGVLSPDYTYLHSTFSFRWVHVSARKVSIRIDR